MQNNKNQVSLRPILFLLVIVLLTGCQKQKIKNHYTGDFTFTAIIRESSPNSSSTIDTVVADGKIKWLKACNINITFSQYRYNVTVNKDDRFTFTDSITNQDPRNSETLKGEFLNDDEVEFTYYWSHAYMGLFTKQIAVKGIRIN